MAEYPFRPQSIAIIGGGVSGLQALRALENLPQLQKIVPRPQPGVEFTNLVGWNPTRAPQCQKVNLMSQGFNSSKQSRSQTCRCFFFLDFPPASDVNGRNLEVKVCCFHFPSSYQKLQRNVQCVSIDGKVHLLQEVQYLIICKCCDMAKWMAQKNKQKVFFWKKWRNPIHIEITEEWEFLLNLPFCVCQGMRFYRGVDMGTPFSFPIPGMWGTPSTWIPS